MSENVRRVEKIYPFIFYKYMLYLKAGFVRLFFLVYLFKGNLQKVVEVITQTKVLRFQPNISMNLILL